MPPCKLAPWGTVSVMLAAVVPVASADPKPQTGAATEPVLVYPDRDWQSVDDLTAAGWSAEGLAGARTYAESLGNLAVMVVENGRVVAQWGDVTRATLVQSVRKSLVSALYGIAINEGKIRLDATLAELDIDDENPSLTPQETQATVRHLLQSRSGVYHDAATTPAEHLTGRPSRGDHAPGEHWYYNNWDFNTLGTIYERATGCDVFAAFDELIARPIGMQDFDVKACEARRESVSIHPAHHFALSARDMARFGLLYMRNGEWQGRRVVPAQWVEASTTAYSGDEREGYGYLWWIQHRIKGFAARGGSAQLILVVPGRGLVFVTQINRHDDTMPDWQKMGKLLSLVLRAKTT